MAKKKDKQTIPAVLNIIANSSPRFRFAANAPSWSFFPYIIYFREGIKDLMDYIYLFYHEFFHIKFALKTRLWHFYERYDLLCKILIEIVLEQGGDSDNLVKVATDIRNKLDVIDSNGLLVEEAYALGKQVISDNWEENRWAAFQSYSVPLPPGFEADKPSKQQFLDELKAIKDSIINNLKYLGIHGKAVSLARKLFTLFGEDIGTWCTVLAIVNKINIDNLDLIKMDYHDLHEKIEKDPLSYSRDFRLKQFVNVGWPILNKIFNAETSKSQQFRYCYKEPSFSKLVENTPIPDEYKEVVMSKFKKYNQYKLPDAVGKVIPFIVGEEVEDDSGKSYGALFMLRPPLPKDNLIPVFLRNQLFSSFFQLLVEMLSSRVGDEVIEFTKKMSKMFPFILAVLYDHYYNQPGGDHHTPPETQEDLQRQLMQLSLARMIAFSSGLKLAPFFRDSGIDMFSSIQKDLPEFQVLAEKVDSPPPIKRRREFFLQESKKHISKILAKLKSNSGFSFFIKEMNCLRDRGMSPIIDAHSAREGNSHHK